MISASRCRPPWISLIARTKRFDYISCGGISIFRHNSNLDMVTVVSILIICIYFANPCLLPISDRALQSRMGINFYHAAHDFDAGERGLRWGAGYYLKLLFNLSNISFYTFLLLCCGMLPFQLILYLQHKLNKELIWQVWVGFCPDIISSFCSGTFNFCFHSI